MLHRHHIVPKYRGGTDDPLNVIELTIEQHARWHGIMFALYGRWQDRVAHLSLSRQITVEEATRLKCSEAGKKRSGKEPWNKGKKGAQEPWNKGKTGVLPPNKHRLGMEPWNKGKRFPHAPRPGQYPQITCPHCGKEGKRGPGMYRFHFNGCEARQ